MRAGDGRRGAAGGGRGIRRVRSASTPATATAVNCAALPAGEQLELSVRAILGDGTRTEVGCVRVRREVRADPSEPLASVVIPCWNQAHYLGEAIESVLDQTHPSSS